MAICSRGTTARAAQYHRQGPHSPSSPGGAPRGYFAAPSACPVYICTLIYIHACKYTYICIYYIHICIYLTSPGGAPRGYFAAASACPICRCTSLNIHSYQYLSIYPYECVCVCVCVCVDRCKFGAPLRSVKEWSVAADVQDLEVRERLQDGRIYIYIYIYIYI